MKQLSVRHHIVVNMSYQLTHFLLKYGVYQMFVNECIYFVNEFPQINVTSYVKRLKYDDAIFTAFCWQDTGFDEMWNYLNIKYLEYCHEQKTRNSKVA